MNESNIVKVGGFPHPRRRVTIADLLARTVSWYSEVIEPPPGCQCVSLHVYQTEAVVTDGELMVELWGGSDPRVGEAFNAMLGSPVAAPVQAIRYSNIIHFGPAFTDGSADVTEFSARNWYRKAVIPSRFRVFFHTRVNVQSYTYSAGLSFS